jgi:hypothetical protein
VNTIVVVMRADGKFYPLAVRSAAEVARLRDLEHQLHCGGGLSIRATQAAMLDRGVRRSIGMIHRDLRQYECPRCAAMPAQPPPPEQ